MTQRSFIVVSTIEPEPPLSENLRIFNHFPAFSISTARHGQKPVDRWLLTNMDALANILEPREGDLLLPPISRATGIFVQRAYEARMTSLLLVGYRQCLAREFDALIIHFACANAASHFIPAAPLREWPGEGFRCAGYDGGERQ